MAVLELKPKECPAREWAKIKKAMKEPGRKLKTLAEDWGHLQARAWMHAPKEMKKLLELRNAKKRSETTQQAIKVLRKINKHKEVERLGYIAEIPTNAVNIARDIKERKISYMYCIRAATFNPHHILTREKAGEPEKERPDWYATILTHEGKPVKVYFASAERAYRKLPNLTDPNERRGLLRYLEALIVRGGLREVTREEEGVVYTTHEINRRRALGDEWDDHVEELHGQLFGREPEWYSGGGGLKGKQVSSSSRAIGEFLTKACEFKGGKTEFGLAPQLLEELVEDSQTRKACLEEVVSSCFMPNFLKKPKYNLSVWFRAKNNDLAKLVFSQLEKEGIVMREKAVGKKEFTTRGHYGVIGSKALKVLKFMRSPYQLCKVMLIAAGEKTGMHPDYRELQMKAGKALFDGRVPKEVEDLPGVQEYFADYFKKRRKEPRGS